MMMTTMVMMMTVVLMAMTQVVSLIMYERYSPSSGRRPAPSIQRAFIYSNAVAQVLVFISSGCNPIVYGICNKNYREFYMQYRLLGR